MISFSYKALDKTGEIVTGKLEANSKEEAGLKLSQRHLTLLVVKQEKAIKPVSLKRIPRVPKKSVLMFTRQLMALSRAGLPLVESLELLVEQPANENLQLILTDISNQIQEGSSFSEALRRYPNTFSELYVNSVHVGEVSGTMDQILQSLVTQLDDEIKLRKDLQKAFRYPMIVISALIMAFVVFISFVIPQFEPVFKKSQEELPLPTKFVLFISDMFSSYWIFMIILLFITFAVFLSVYRTDRGKYWIHRYLLKLPLYGNLLRKIASQRFAGTLSLLNSNGIPLVQAMNTAINIETNMVYKEEIEKLQKRVEKGENIAMAMNKGLLFSKLMIHMVSVGEVTGSLDEMLRYASEFNTTEIKETVDKLTALIEPVVTIILALMVLLLALSIFLPMWNMLGIH